MAAEQPYPRNELLQLLSDVLTGGAAKNWTQLKFAAAAIKTREDQLKREIVQFRVHLMLNPKFQGTELICTACEKVWTGRKVPMSPSCTGVAVPYCKDCGGTQYREDRKDFIATVDVLRWLDGIESVLRG